MWEITEPTVSKKTLDFSSSGQGFQEVSQLISGDVVLINALELIEWDEDGTQVMVCASCGIPRCASGGWVAFRKAGNCVLMIPAFDFQEEANELKDEYAAPRYLKEVGIPFFQSSTYNELVEAGVGFPVMNHIHPLKLSEAARIYQLEAPYRVFDTPPSLSIHPSEADLVVGASDGDHEAALREALMTLEEFRRDSRPALFRDLSVDDEVVSIFLDGSEFTEFKCLVKVGNEIRLLFDGNQVIEPLEDGKETI